MNPAQNTFLTGSHDGTVILWDQRADKAQVRRMPKLIARAYMLIVSDVELDLDREC